MQTNSAIQLGGPFPRYSTLLGQQYYARLSALNQNGNWWIYLGGTDPSHAIGYYPAAVFHGRPITTAANLIEYGGEVVGSTVWPQMGSGSYAQARFRHAAAEKQISYFPDPSSSVQANLAVFQPLDQLLHQRHERQQRLQRLELVLLLRGARRVGVLSGTRAAALRPGVPRHGPEPARDDRARG